VTAGSLNQQSAFDPAVRMAITPERSGQYLAIDLQKIFSLMEIFYLRNNVLKTEAFAAIQVYFITFYQTCQYLN